MYNRPTPDNRHYRRALGMQRHFVPSNGGGHIDQVANDTGPQVATEGQAIQSRPPTYQGQLPTGGRGTDRQVNQ
jgi:hypothetical protein